MSKPRPIISQQSREDIRKVSDLVEVAGSRPAYRRWCIDGTCYGYAQGGNFLHKQAGVTPMELIPLDGCTAAAAKKAIFADIRA